MPAKPATLIVLCVTVACSPDDRPADVVAAAVTVPSPRAEPPHRADGVATKLFAGDVPLDTLPLSLAIETIGGVSTIVIPRGTPLPASHSEVFSTAADDQSSVEVHVAQGERPQVADNRDLGRFQLTGIPPAPRGVPQIRVTFAIDKDGVLDVSARDLATNRQRSIVVTAVGAQALDKKSLDKILADTDAARADDALKRRWAETRNQLDAMVYSSRKLLVDAGAKVPPTLRARWEDALRDAESTSTARRDANGLTALHDAFTRLQTVTHTVAETLYRSAGP